MMQEIQEVKEEWRVIRNFDGDYDVSNMSRVRSSKSGELKILKSFLLDGRQAVQLRKNNKGYTKYIHNLMYSAFVEEVPKGYVVHHCDFNPLNNKLDNFQMMTIEEHITLHKTGTKHSEVTKKK